MDERLSSSSQHHLIQRETYRVNSELPLIWIPPSAPVLPNRGIEHGDSDDTGVLQDETRVVPAFEVPGRHKDELMKRYAVPLARGGAWRVRGEGITAINHPGMRGWGLSQRKGAEGDNNQEVWCHETGEQLQTLGEMVCRHKGSRSGYLVLTDRQQTHQPISQQFIRARSAGQTQLTGRTRLARKCEERAEKRKAEQQERGREPGIKRGHLIRTSRITASQTERSFSGTEQAKWSLQFKAGYGPGRPRRARRDKSVFILRPGHQWWWWGFYTCVCSLTSN
ncbi:unnamed protein product [Pleuronectes platessa]|uniref:Uncharacterized protein n=1 Tax=Pleuronectes platessa TaxID=8262 RepID=A0A9N7YKC4_PLEPL|nr:unnamed protein product [Pleuronectes platessa]